MAGDWLKMEAKTPEKAEVLAITTRMGWEDPDLVVGKLFRVWRWFDQHTIDGNAKSVTSSLLDRICGVTGFADAMESVGWLVVTGDGILLPNFSRHCGKTAKDRAETAKRVAGHRAGKPERLPTERAGIPRQIRALVYARDGNSCVYCGRKNGEFTPPEMPEAGTLCLDHVIPVCRNGSDDLINLVSACTGCNMYKSDRTPEECGFEWPIIDGVRSGNVISVTNSVAREEKTREEKIGTRKERGIPPSPAAPGDQGRKGKSAKKPPPITQTDLAIEAYNRILGKTKARPEGLPRAMRINMPAKQEMVRKCSDIAREMCQELYGSPQVTAEFWEQYFGTVSRDPFKSGRQKPGPGHEGWVPDFEYLLKRRTMMQVFERSGAADEPE
jgi:hypothetical protein